MTEAVSYSAKHPSFGHNRVNRDPRCQPSLAPMGQVRFFIADILCRHLLEPSDETVSVRAPHNGPVPCRACGSDRQRHLYEVEGYAIDRCLACGFVQVRDEPAPELLEKIYAVLHLKHSTYRSEEAAVVENGRRLKLLDKLVPRGARVLDAGCASGDFLQAAKASFSLSGMDISAAAIEVAKARNPELATRLWAGRIEDIAPDRGPFDAIVLWDVIEHVWDPVGTCRSLFEHLVPNGLLLLSTPDSGAMAARLMGKRWAFMIPPEHLGLFSQKGLRRLVETVVPSEVVYHRSRASRPM